MMSSIFLITLLFRSSYMLTILNCILVIILHHPVMIYLLLSINYMNVVLLDSWPELFRNVLHVESEQSLAGANLQDKWYHSPSSWICQRLWCHCWPWPDLKFDAHISLAVHKAMIRSRLKLQCFFCGTKDLLLEACITYIRPILEYCSPVLSPHLKYLINKKLYCRKEAAWCFVSVSS